MGKDSTQLAWWISPRWRIVPQDPMPAHPFEVSRG